jgi:hypothetical protein
MILEVPSAQRELGPDLLVCGAPLRNRTVDLLLTICNSLGSPPGQLLLQADGKRRPGSSRGLRHLRSLRPSFRLPRSRWWSMPSKWQDPTLTAPGCRSGPASGAACRPATSAPTVKTRSDDLCCPARPGPEGTSRRFLSPGRFEPLPLSSPRMKATAAAQESPEPKITPRHMQDTESGPGWQGAATSIGPPDPPGGGERHDNSPAGGVRPRNRLGCRDFRLNRRVASAPVCARAARCRKGSVAAQNGALGVRTPRLPAQPSAAPSRRSARRWSRSRITFCN